MVGTATDDEIDMADTTTVSSTNNNWTLEITEGTLKSGLSESDLTITGLPVGLSATAARGTETDTILVTVAGAADDSVSSAVNVDIVVKGSAVVEDEAEASDPIGVTLNPAQTSPIQVKVEAADSVVTMAEGNEAVSADNDWELEITEGTLADEIDNGDLEITGLPAGLTWTASRDSADTILVTVAGTANPAVNAAANVSIVVKGSAVTEAEASNSEAVSVTVSPAPDASLDVQVSGLPAVFYKGQSETIHASATKNSSPATVNWSVTVNGEPWTFTAPSDSWNTVWGPKASDLPVERVDKMVVTATFDGGAVVTKNYDINFINYSIYVTGVNQGASSVIASIENLDEAVSGQCVFQFFSGDTPVGCEVVPKAIAAGSSTVTCSSLPTTFDKVKVSVIQLGSGDDPWDGWLTLSSFYEYGLSS